MGARKVNATHTSAFSWKLLNYAQTLMGKNATMRMEEPSFGRARSDVSGLNLRHNDYDDLRINKLNEFPSRKKEHSPTGASAMKRRVGQIDSEVWRCDGFNWLLN